MRTFTVKRGETIIHDGIVYADGDEVPLELIADSPAVHALTVPEPLDLAECGFTVRPTWRSKWGVYAIDSGDLILTSYVTEDEARTLCRFANAGLLYMANDPRVKREYRKGESNGNSCYC